MWVEEHSRGQRFEIFFETDLEAKAEFGISRTVGLVQLLGSNPNAPAVKTTDWSMVKD
jgi:hypothetical protein